MPEISRSDAKKAGSQRMAITTAEQAGTINALLINDASSPTFEARAVIRKTIILGYLVTER